MRFVSDTDIAHLAVHFAPSLVLVVAVAPSSSCLFYSAIPYFCFRVDGICCCVIYVTDFGLCSPVTLVVSAIPSSTFCAYVSLLDRLDGIV